MAKDWRLAVCNRSRIILALLSLVLSWASLTVLWSFAITVSQAYQASQLERRIERLKIGITEDELVRVMGRPSFEGPVTAERIGQEQAYSHLRRLEYYPKWGPLKSGSYRSWVVMLDDEANKVIEISPGGFGLVEVDYSPKFRWIAGGAIVGLALVIWLLILRWCRRGRETQINKGMT